MCVIRSLRCVLCPHTHCGLHHEHINTHTHAHTHPRLPEAMQNPTKHATVRLACVRASSTRVPMVFSPQIYSIRNNNGTCVLSVCVCVCVRGGRSGDWGRVHMTHIDHTTHACATRTEQHTSVCIFIVHCSSSECVVIFIECVCVFIAAILFSMRSTRLWASHSRCSEYLMQLL